MIKLDLNILPESLKASIESEKRFHARINVDADEASELNFSDWEAE